MKTTIYKEDEAPSGSYKAIQISKKEEHKSDLNIGFGR